MNQRQRARLVTNNIDRREFLRRAGLVGGGVLLTPALLAACGSDGGSSSPTTAPRKANAGGGGDLTKLIVSNWPLYVDPTEDGTKGSIDLFKAASKIDVKYTEDLNDNNEFFAKIQPELASGKSIQQDLFAPTYWMAARLVALGWLDGLPLDEMKNTGNLIDGLKNPKWDPLGQYNLPWQSGITGIAYNKKAAGRELTSVKDLFDPKFKGKIGMLKEMRDTIGLLMLGEGKDPSKATFDDAAGAFDKLLQAKDSGQIRSFTGNDYQDDLIAGNFIACVGWSGDVAQLALDEPDLAFAVPEEGGMTWYDTFVMPKGAQHRSAAAKFLDYFYDPVNAARVAAYVGYISPVKGVQEELRKNKDTAALAESPLMFPDDATRDRLHFFNTLSDSEEARFDKRFSEITSG